MNVQLLTPQLVEELIGRARQSPRRRTNHNFHSGPADNPHRFLNVLLEGTYIQPHRHLTPPKAETFVVLEGRVAAFVFDETGRVTARHDLGPGAPAHAIDIAPGVWHSIACLTRHAVCFEVKPGPWDPSADKEFASWAPAEGDPGVPAFLKELLAANAA